MVLLTAGRGAIFFHHTSMYFCIAEAPLPRSHTFLINISERMSGNGLIESPSRTAAAVMLANAVILCES